MLKGLFEHFFSKDKNFKNSLTEILKKHRFHILNMERDGKDNLFFKLSHKGYNITLQVNVKDFTGKIIIDDNILCFKFRKPTDIVEELLKILSLLESSFEFKSFSFIENLQIYYNERIKQLKHSYLYLKLSNTQMHSLQLLNLRAEKFLEKKCLIKD